MQEKAASLFGLIPGTSEHALRKAVGSPTLTPPTQNIITSSRNLLNKLDKVHPTFFEEEAKRLAGISGRAAAKEIGSEAKQLADNILQQFKREIGPISERAVKKSIEQGGLSARKAFATGTRTLGAMATLGAGAAIAFAPKEEHKAALTRGLIGGILGAGTGASLLPRRSGLHGRGLIPVLGGALLGGALAGYTTNKPPLKTLKKKEASMIEGHKFAGVTLDYYDDHGETLLDLFPTANELPAMIKTADVQPKEKLPNEAFALIMVDSGHVFRKFACADPGTTMMSVVYFMEHGDKLPEDSQKTAAAGLVEACIKHQIMPPAGLTKTAAPSSEVGPVVDVTGRNPEARVVVDRPVDEDDYCVKLADGTLHYPIDTWDRVKQAEAYFQEERIRMEPEVRRQYAVKLARRSFIMGYPLSHDITDLGALSYQEDGALKGAVEMRKSACDPRSAETEFLDDLFEKRAVLHPEVYAECLRRFDVHNGFDKGWDQVILDPWSSTFGVKTAAVVWEQGAERVTEEELINLARNDAESLKKQFTEQFLDEFQKNPVVLFKSMPDPQKKILARLAVDVASSGESEFMPTAAPEHGGGGHNKTLR